MKILMKNLNKMKHLRKSEPRNSQDDNLESSPDDLISLNCKVNDFFLTGVNVDGKE